MPESILWPLLLLAVTGLLIWALVALASSSQPWLRWLGSVEQPIEFFPGIPPANFLAGMAVFFLPIGLAKLVRLVRIRRLPPESSPEAEARRKFQAQEKESNRGFEDTAVAGLLEMLFQLLVFNPIAKMLPARPIEAVSMPLALWCAFSLSPLITTWFRESLPKEHEVVQEAITLGRSARIRIWRVELACSPRMYASLNSQRILLVSTGLLKNLTAAERKAVLAQAIGEMRPRKFTLTVVLGSVFAIASLSTVGIANGDKLPFGPNKEAAPVLALTLLMAACWVIMVALARQGSKRQFRGDAFAVEATGNPDALISALTKMTDTNQQPRRLGEEQKRSNQADLESRIYAIREGRV